MQFDLEFEFRFAGGVPPAKTRFTCGPSVSAITGPPSVTNVSVLPATGTVQAGDTLHVTYSVTASGILWSTTVQVGGPFGFRREIPEESVTSVTRTVDVVVPPSAFFDVPITVSVEATDVALQNDRRDVATPLTVVDVTPPEVRSATWPFTPNGPQYFAGDTIQLSVDAFDNNSLAWVVWDVTGAVTVHDSVHAPAGMTSGTVKIPFVTSPAWLGVSTVAVYVRDGTGAASPVRTADPVRVAPTYEYPVSAVATAPRASFDRGDIAFDEKRGRIYLTLGQRNDFDVLDVATATFGTPIVLPSPGAGLDLSVSGDSLLVVEPATKSIAVVNLAQSGAPSIIPLTVLDTAGEALPGVAPQPRGIRVAANGLAIIQLLNHTASGDGALSLDLGSGLQRVRSDGQPRVPLVEMMAATPDRSQIVIFDPNCPRTYVAATDAFSSCGLPQTPYDIHPLRFDAAGRRFSLGNAVYDLSFNRLDPSPTIFGVSGVSVLSPDGETLYLATSSTYVTLLHAVDGSLLGRFAVPFQPQAMVMAPGGEWLMVFRRDDVVKAARVDLKQGGQGP